jgi:hypothetical protein
MALYHLVHSCGNYANNEAGNELTDEAYYIYRYKEEVQMYMSRPNTHHSPGPGVGPLIQQLLDAIHVATGSGEYKRCSAILWKTKSEFVPVHAMRACKGNKGIDPLVTLGSSLR